MGGTAPANQLRLSFPGSEDGEAETETCRAAKPLWRTTTRTSGPQGLNSLNRHMRTRLYGGVGGASRRLFPLSRFLPAFPPRRGFTRCVTSWWVNYTRWHPVAAATVLQAAA